MVIATQQSIKIVLEYFTKGLSKLDRANKRINTGINNQAAAVAKQNAQIAQAPLAHKKTLTNTIARGRAMDNLTKTTVENNRMNQTARQGFSKTMGMTQENFKKFNQQGRKFTTTGGRMANSFRKGTHGLRGFRMEMLGVMFFGMMLSRTFSGLLKTSLDWLGVTEILTLTLGLLFLPVAEDILVAVIKFNKWVGTLNREQKLWIGRLVLLGAALGGLIFLLGTFALGIGSLIMVFGSLLTPIGLVLAGIAGFVILKVAAGWFTDLSDKAAEADEKIATFGISGNYVTEALNKFRELIDGMKLVIEEKKPVLEAAGKTAANSLFNGIKLWLSENPMMVVGAIAGAWLGGPVGAGIGAVIGKLFQEIDFKKMDVLIESGLEMLDTMLQGIKDNAPKISEAMVKLLSALGDWIGKNFFQLVWIGLQIASAIIVGIVKGFWNIGAQIGETISRVLKISPEEPRGFQHGGIVPGRLGSAVPIMAHAGERIIPANRVGAGAGGGMGNSVNLNVTYNVEVSDTEEMERMFRQNNLNLVEEVKRTISI